MRMRNKDFSIREMVCQLKWGCSPTMITDQRYYWAACLHIVQLKAITMLQWQTHSLTSSHIPTSVSPNIQRCLRSSLNSPTFQFPGRRRRRSMSLPLVEIPVFGALADDFVDNPVSQLKPCLPASLPSPQPSRLGLLLFSFAGSLVLPHNSIRPILTPITSTRCLSCPWLHHRRFLTCPHTFQGERKTFFFPGSSSPSQSTSFLLGWKCFCAAVLLTEIKEWIKWILLSSLRRMVIRQRLNKASTQPSQHWFL